MNNKFSLAFVLVVFCATTTFCAPTEETRLKKRDLTWRSVAGYVACGGQAKTAKQISITIKDELKVISTKYDYVVFVTSDEHGFSYVDKGWELNDNRNGADGSACGWDILVFRRPNKSCPSSLDTTLTLLQKSAARHSNTFAGVLEIIGQRDIEYDLKYDLIITYKDDDSSWWATYTDTDCSNVYDAGNSKISSIVVAQAV